MSNFFERMGRKVHGRVIRRRNLAASNGGPQLRDIDSHDVGRVLEQEAERETAAGDAQLIDRFVPLVDLAERLQIALGLHRPGVRKRVEGAVRSDGQEVVAAEVAEDRTQPLLVVGRLGEHLLEPADAGNAQLQVMRRDAP